MTATKTKRSTSRTIRPLVIKNQIHQIFQSMLSNTNRVLDHEFNCKTHDQEEWRNLTFVTYVPDDDLNSAEVKYVKGIYDEVSKQAFSYVESVISNYRKSNPISNKQAEGYVRIDRIKNEILNVINRRFLDVNTITYNYASSGKYYSGDHNPFTFFSDFKTKCHLTTTEDAFIKSIDDRVKTEASETVRRFAGNLHMTRNYYSKMNNSSQYDNSMRFRDMLNVMPGVVPNNIHQQGMMRPMPAHEAPMGTYQNPNGLYNSSGYTPYPNHGYPPGYINTPVGIKPMGEQFNGVYPQDNRKTTCIPNVDPTMQQGLKFTNVYEILFMLVNLPENEKHVVKHMVNYIIENKDCTDEKVQKLVEAYKISIEAICDMV